VATRALPLNFQLPICERCLQLGERREMRMIVGRAMEDDYGMYWYDCANCGKINGPFYCPLYWLAASNLDELSQILAFARSGAKVEVRRVSDLSPGAKEVLERVGMNPLALAEVASELALKRAAADRRVKELEEELAGVRE